MSRSSSVRALTPTDDRFLESISLRTIDQLSYDSNALEEAWTDDGTDRENRDRTLIYPSIPSLVMTNPTQMKLCHGTSFDIHGLRD